MDFIFLKFNHLRKNIRRHLVLHPDRLWLEIEHYCELVISLTKEVNPSLISALSTCLDFFRFYIVLRRPNTPKIIISARLGIQGELRLSRPCLSSQEWASLSFSLSLILLHAAILTVPEWQARGRGC